jgi:hypothetical protein
MGEYSRRRRWAKAGVYILALAVCLVGTGVFASVGQAGSAPSTAFTPASVNFGSVSSGSSSRTLTLKNTGGSATAVLSLALSGSPAFVLTADHCSGTSLGPNKSCTATVTYSPTTGGSTDTAALTARGQKPTTTATASLSGNSFASFSQTTCTGSPCVASTSTASSSVTVVATGGSSGTLQAGISTGTLSCSYPAGITDLDPNTFTVVSSSSAYGKTVTIVYTPGAGAPPLDLNDDDAGPDGDNDYDDVKWTTAVCFQAPYPFLTSTGSQASGPDGQGNFTGLLPDCPASGPCVDRAASSTIPNNNNTGYQISLVIDIPPGQPGDPRMN